MEWSVAMGVQAVAKGGDRVQDSGVAAGGHSCLPLPDAAAWSLDNGVHVEAMRRLR